MSETRRDARETARRLLLLLPVIGITVGVYLVRDQLKRFESWGYPGIFLLSVLANATVIIPVPGVVITSAMAAVFNPLAVAIAAGLGAALGELTGYMAGYSGQVVVENSPRYQRLVDWMRRNGSGTILVLAFIPNPAFDMAGIVAGGLKMPVGKFLLWCALGKILKMILFAYAGSTFFGWLGGLFAH